MQAYPDVHMHNKVILSHQDTCAALKHYSIICGTFSCEHPQVTLQPGLAKSVHGDYLEKLVSSCIAGMLAPLKLVDDTFVNVNTGKTVELHGFAWVRTNLMLASILIRRRLALSLVTP